MTARIPKKKRERYPDSVAAPASVMPFPGEGERPALYADRAGEWYVARTSDEHRRKQGLYLTPVVVADFMARRIRATGRRLRILDPAAGGGILACAAVEVLASRPDKPEVIELVACEEDRGLTPVLQRVFECLADWCRINRGVELSVRIETTDFILAHAEKPSLFDPPFSRQGNENDFDVVIANPPYFKIGKNDLRAVAMSNVVHGQPNIYGLFMAASAAVLKRRGDFIFIVPRSFASGPYFRRFRTVFFDVIRPIEVHVFGSRREAFSRDDILQENVVFFGARDDRWSRSPRHAPLVLSSSRGIRDMAEPDRRSVPMEMALDLASADKVLRLPLSDEDDAALALVESWPTTLRGLGLNISTGPVMPFRAVGLIDGEGETPSSHAPMLWMNHVRPMTVTWPLDRRKPEYIKRVGAESLLTPNGNYVLLRRFSAKEEARRLIAAPYVASDFNVPEVGLENHLNYIHRPGGSLTEDETWGLAALYNSRLLDVYFRVVNGNTQVSATELRAMPLPSRGIVVALGRRVKRLADPLEGLDDLVMRLVACPELREVAVG